MATKAVSIVISCDLRKRGRYVHFYNTIFHLSVCMDGSRYKELQQVPLNEMDDSQAFQYINCLFQFEEEITPDHLELTFQHRLFKKSIQIMNKGVDSKMIGIWMNKILQSNVQLDSDFLALEIFLLASGTNLKPIFTEIDSFCTENIKESALLFYNLLIQEEAGVLHDNSYHELINLIIDSYKNKDTCLTDIFLKYIINEKINLIHENTISDLKNIKSVMESPEITQRTIELSNELDTCTKGLHSISANLDQFKEQYMKCADALESFILQNFLKNMKMLNSTVAKIRMLSAETKKIQMAIDTIINQYVDSFLLEPSSEKAIQLIQDIKSVCIRYASGDVFKEDFNMNIYITSIISHCVGIFRRYAKDPNELFIDQLKLLKDKLSSFVDRITQEIPLYYETVVEPADLVKSYSTPSSGIYKCLRYASDRFLFSLYYAECYLLESIVKEDAFFNSEKSSFYPVAFSKIFTNMIKKPAVNAAHNTKVQREELHGFITERVTKFLIKTRGIPGSRKDTKYSDFEPPEIWVWTKFPGLNFNFPTKPDDVRSVLMCKIRIAHMIHEYKLAETTPKCNNCNIAIAVNVCPKCKKLVLCNRCMSNLKHCPLDGCDYTFDL